MQVALLQTGARGLCALAISPAPRCQQFFFVFFAGWAAILESRKPVSWFTHFLQRFTVKWDKKTSETTQRKCARLRGKKAACVVMWWYLPQRD